MFGNLFGNRPIRNRVRLLGVHNDQPAFEYQGIAPPDWLMKALREKVIHVKDGLCYIRDEAQDMPTTIHRKMVA